MKYNTKNPAPDYGSQGVCENIVNLKKSPPGHQLKRFDPHTGQETKNYAEQNNSRSIPCLLPLSLEKKVMISITDT